MSAPRTPQALQPYYGVTPPISTAFSDEVEIEATNRLFETLKELETYDTDEGAKKR